jgi:DNA-binding response OmpR family regulator|uniref:Phosphate regulon transcriptional regulatory protein PhoB n=1 Tax=Desulfomonile tiedjei TaxID=2358 RepID=A0A7C4ESD5_9BACT
MNGDHILLVDDDPDICTILKDNLELDGYHVIIAATGREALEAAKNTGLSLIILDLSLPDTDGLHVCRSIRNHSQVPIIMLTARDRVTDKVLGLECGADDYMVKPFDYLELAARIRACLRRTGRVEAEPAVIRTGALTIDTAKKKAFKSGKEVELTRKEFELLVFLVKHAERALTRKEIRQGVWPEGRIYQDSRAIDVHIQHLRQKIEDDASQPRLIQTVAGVGYMYSSGKPDSP